MYVTYIIHDISYYYSKFFNFLVVPQIYGIEDTITRGKMHLK